MIDTVFLEKKISCHERSQQILKKLPRANVVEIDRYQEVFNKRTQNFRLQKQNTALILAKKHKNFVLPIPKGFGLGSKVNYYFSHMYNCIYDCRYCFLQGMYSSANLVVFVNFEDFFDELKKLINSHQNDTVTFFSGYDCDSLAFEKITKFVETATTFFKKFKNVELEIRTKSVQPGSLLRLGANSNIIIAYSLMPERLARDLDIRAPSIKRRVSALNILARAGWPVGLRFDPMIYCEGWKVLYEKHISKVMKDLPPESVHSVTLGPLRFPKGMYKKINKLYPEHPLFAGHLLENQGIVSYAPSLELEMASYLEDILSNYVDENRIYRHNSRN